MSLHSTSNPPARKTSLTTTAAALAAARLRDREQRRGLFFDDGHAVGDVFGDLARGASIRRGHRPGRAVGHASGCVPQRGAKVVGQRPGGFHVARGRR